MVMMFRIVGGGRGKRGEMRERGDGGEGAIERGALVNIEVERRKTQ